MPRKSVSETVRAIHSHPHTASLFEDLSLITKANKIKHNPLLYTNLHIHQMNLAKVAFRTELPYPGLAENAVMALRACAKLDFSGAQSYTRAYCADISNALYWAESSLAALSGYTSDYDESVVLKRNHVAKRLSITVDALRNWELNKVITVERSKNGYRVYTESDLTVLGIVLILRYAGNSLAESAAYMKDFSFENENKEIKSICASMRNLLEEAKKDAEQMCIILKKTENQYTSMV